jgi:hypothetical protein
MATATWESREIAVRLVVRVSTTGTTMSVSVLPNGRCCATHSWIHKFHQPVLSPHICICIYMINVSLSHWLKLSHMVRKTSQITSSLFACEVLKRILQQQNKLKPIISPKNSYIQIFHLVFLTNMQLKLELWMIRTILNSSSMVLQISRCIQFKYCVFNSQVRYLRNFL